MKIAVVGKGGVGKTLVASTLARLIARDGYKVLAVDADPNFNLASAIGFPREIVEKIIPLSENDVLIAEKTGVSSENTLGAVFNMSPKVDDIVRRYGVIGPDGVNLLVMGTVKSGNSGCMCGANALLRVLMQHLLIQRDEVVIMDMEAGIEHFGRGTARRMDLMLVVLEPRWKSIDTVTRIVKLAKQIEVKKILAVANKVNNVDEMNYLKDHVKILGIPIIVSIPYDINVAEADMKGIPLLDYNKNSSALIELFRLEKIVLESNN